MNPLGDGVSESLSCLLSCCPVLAKRSLQACGLTARFLQQHRLLLASALTGDSNKQLTEALSFTELPPISKTATNFTSSERSGTGHLKAVCLSLNPLGSTGFELVLKTLPLHCLPHVDLSAVCRGPADYPALEHLAKVLSQVCTQKSCNVIYCRKI